MFISFNNLSFINKLLLKEIYVILYNCICNYMDFVVANYHTLFLKIGIFLERLVYQSLLSDLYNRKNRGISRLKNKIIKY